MKDKEDKKYKDNAISDLLILVVILSALFLPQIFIKGDFGVGLGFVLFAVACIVGTYMYLHNTDMKGMLG